MKGVKVGEAARGEEQQEGMSWGKGREERGKKLEKRQRESRMGKRKVAGAKGGKMKKEERSGKEEEAAQGRRGKGGGATGGEKGRSKCHSPNWECGVVFVLEY